MTERRSSGKKTKKRKSRDATPDYTKIVGIGVLGVVLVIGLLLIWPRKRASNDQAAATQDPVAASAQPGGVASGTNPSAFPVGSGDPSQRCEAYLNADLERHQAETDAYIKRRQERPEQGQFEFLPEATTQSQLNSATRKFFQRDREGDPSKSIGSGSSTEASNRFVNACIDQIIDPGAHSLKEMRDLESAATAAGATDDFFLAHQSIGRLSVGEASPALTSQLEKAVDGLAKANRCPRTVFLGRRWLTTIAHRANDGTKSARGRAAIQALGGLFGTPREPLDSRVIYTQVARLYESLDSTLQFELLIALTEIRDVDPWLCQVWAGIRALDVGWSARGNGTADTVSPSRWEAFQEELDRASRHLRRAVQLHPEFPEAASTMIEVGKADARHLSGEFWFYEAVRAQPDHKPSYERYLSALLPRWGGSHTKMVEFGIRALRTGRYDVGVPQTILLVIARIERDIAETAGDPNSVLGVAGAVTSLKRLLDDLKQKRDAAGKPYLESISMTDRSRLVRYLAMGGEYGLATDVLNSCEDRYDDAQFTAPLMSPAAVRGWIRGMATGSREEFKRLKADYITLSLDPVSGPRPDDIAGRVKSLGTLPDAEGTTDFLDLVNSRVQMRQAFDRGEWVTLTCDGSNLDTWEYHSDRVNHSSPTDVELGSTAKSGNVQMALQLLFPMPYEFEATVGTSGEKIRGPAGILIGDSRDHLGESGPLLSVKLADGDFRLDPNTELLVVNASLDRIETEPGMVMIPKKPAHRLNVIIWKDRFDVIFQGDSLQLGEQFWPTYAGSSAIAIGGRYPDTRWDAQQLRVSSPRIRKVPYGPTPPLTAAPKTQLKYFNDVLAVHPDSARAHQRLAKILWKTDRQSARKHADQALEVDPSITGLRPLRIQEYAAQSRYIDALKDADAEFQVSRQDFFTRTWLMMLLCAVPDDQLRDVDRARKLLAESQKLAQMTGRQAGDLLRVQAMLAGEDGNFEEALKILAAVRQLPSNDAEDRQWIEQQQNAFQQKKPFRFQPLKSAPKSK